MILKLLLSLLLFSSNICFAEGRIMGEKATDMLTDAAVLALKSGNRETIEKVANEIQRHLSLNQYRFKEGGKPQALINLQAKMINYLGIQDKLDQCDEGRRTLGRRYLNSALSSAMFNSETTKSETEELVYLSDGNWSYDQATDTCRKVIFSEIGPIKDLVTDVVEVLAFSEKKSDPLMPTKERMTKTNFKFLAFEQKEKGVVDKELNKKFSLQKEIYLNSLMNSARNMTDLSYRYTNKSEKKIIEEVLAKTCKAPCSTVHHEQITEAIKKQISISSQTFQRKRQSEGQRNKNVSTAICSMFQHLHDTSPQYKDCEQRIIVKTHEKKNSIEDMLKIDPNKMMANPGSDHIAMVRREQQQEIRNRFCYEYYQKKLQIASEGIGLLILTDTFQEKGLDCTNPDSKANQETINKSINFMEEKNQEFVNNLNQNMHETLNPKSSKIAGEESSNNLVTENLKKLLKENPASTGQTLLSDPSYSAMVCELLGAIEEDDNFQENLDATVRIGGAIVGTALAVGSIFAPPLGIPAGAVFGMTTASVGLTLGSGLYSASEMNRFHKIESDVKASFFANNGDIQSIEDIRIANEKKLDATTTLILDAVTLGFDGVQLAKMGKLAKTKDMAKVAPELTSSEVQTQRTFSKFEEEVNEGNAFLKSWYSDTDAIKPRMKKLTDAESWFTRKGPKIRKNVKNTSQYTKAATPADEQEMFGLKKYSRYEGKVNGMAYPEKDTAFVFQKARNPASTAVHEGTHQIMQTEDLYSAKAWELLESPVMSRQKIYDKFGLNHYTTPQERFSFSNYVDHVTSPPEFHARLNQLRHHYGLKPTDIVDNKFIEKVMEEGLSGQTPVSPDFFEMIGNEKAFMNVFNEMF